MSKTKGTTDMADVKFDDFLLQYFMQWRFNNMPPEVRAQFDVYVRNNDFNGHMGQWRTHLMDAQGNNKPEPDPNGQEYHLTDAEWEKMFKEFQNAFHKMNKNRASFANSVDFDQTNKNALDFLDEYYGPNRLFESKVTVTPNAEQQLRALAQLLSQHENTLKLQLNEWGITDQDIKYKDLIDGIGTQKYLTDDKFRDKIKRLAETITAYTTDPYHIGRNPGLQQALGQQNFSAVYNGFTEGNIEQWQLNEFKRTCTSMLARLANNGKLREVFPSNAIQTAFKGAKERVAYDDPNSKDYVPPKRKDELNFMQTMSEWVSDTYEDTMAKYLRFTGDRLYFSSEAKQIVSALHSEKLKPTDGLGAVLKKAGDIKKRLQYKSPRATGYFDWFAKTMTELQQTMPKAFEGALSNGRKMRAIVSEMIMIAVRDGKVKEAKAAMEVLSVIKYGYTTSKIMDALKKEDLTLFSDGKLSWNKTKGMQFITKAMDKSIKTAFMGIGYGVTMVGNALWLSGSKFNGQRGNRLNGAQQNWDRQNQQQRSNLENQQQLDISQRDANQQTLNNMNSMLGINATNIDTHRQNLATAQQNQYNDEQRRIQLQQKLAGLPTEIQTATDELTNLNNTRIQLDNELRQLGARVAYLRTEIANPATPPANIPVYQRELDYLQRAQIPHLQSQRTQTVNDIDNKRNEIIDMNDRLNNIIPAEIARLDTSIHSQEVANHRVELQLNTWTEASNTVRNLSDNINRRDETLRNWDQNHQDEYRQLMAYWDMLETGRDTHTGEMYNWFGRFSGKRAQEDFDARKQNYINNYVNNYSYAS